MQKWVESFAAITFGWVVCIFVLLILVAMLRGAELSVWLRWTLVIVILLPPVVGSYFGGRLMQTIGGGLVVGIAAALLPLITSAVQRLADVDLPGWRGLMQVIYQLAGLSVYGVIILGAAVLGGFLASRKLRKQGQQKSA